MWSSCTNLGSSWSSVMFCYLFVPAPVLDCFFYFDFVAYLNIWEGKPLFVCVYPSLFSFLWNFILSYTFTIASWMTIQMLKEVPHTLVPPSCPQDPRQVKVRLLGPNLPYCTWLLPSPSIRLKFNVLVDNYICYQYLTFVDFKCSMLFYRVLYF